MDLFHVSKLNVKFSAGNAFVRAYYTSEYSVSVKSVTLSVCTQLPDSSQLLCSEDSDSVSSSLHSKNGSASVTSPALMQPWH